MPQLNKKIQYFYLTLHVFGHSKLVSILVVLNQYVFTYFVSPNYFGIVDLETTHFVGHIIYFETQKHKSMLLLFFPTLFYFILFCDL
jgi:hypothetical protein